MKHQQNENGKVTNQFINLGSAIRSTDRCVTIA